MNALDFNDRLRTGKTFEIHAVEVLKRELNWDIGLYLTKAEQWEHGESRGRVEIKFDRKVRATGNLFIEVKERRDESGISQWRQAGIYDASDPWFYAIGDEQTIWFWATSQLRLAHSTGRYRMVNTGTSEGFLMPLPDADKYAIRRIEEAHESTF